MLSLGRPLDVQVQLSSQRLNDESGDRDEGQAGGAPESRWPVDGIQSCSLGVCLSHARGLT